MMKMSECTAGYLRLNQLMIDMIHAVDVGDKEFLIKMSRHFSEDSEDFVGFLLDAAEVSDDDFAKYPIPDEDEMLKDAASAEIIRTAKVN